MIIVAANFDDVGCKQRSADKHGYTHPELSIEARSEGGIGECKKHEDEVVAVASIQQIG